MFSILSEITENDENKQEIFSLYSENTKIIVNLYILILKKRKKNMKEYEQNFIQLWGTVGTNWGINRTMAQINGLLLISKQALSTDDIMEKLSISRGNAHSNIKDLQNMGIIRNVIKQGDRKEYFESEKDPWKLFCIVSRERNRHEIEPLIGGLTECLNISEKDKDSDEFNTQVKELLEFIELASKIMTKIGNSEKNLIIKSVMKLLSI